jgi:NDP-4-keto-2,6-dideoxyhexose 3-C-methyltransferase
VTQPKLVESPFVYKELDACRICGNTDLVPILDLGHQALTGVFPKHKHEMVPEAPLELVKCNETSADDSCGLVQLRHSCSHTAMYGDKYGYRSGLNASMVAHLRQKVQTITSRVDLRPGDLVIDIGSNDSTLLQSYPSDRGLTLVGVDPSGAKLRKYYPSHIQLLPEFFSAQTVRAVLGGRKAKVVTSIAMFYDLEAPCDFMRHINEVLADDGVWVFEQSYLPSMLDTVSYDTVCHEHLEYYALRQIKWMTDRLQLKIIDISFNDVNGGSFSIMVAKSHSPYRENKALISQVLEKERRIKLDTLEPYHRFEEQVQEHRASVCRLLSELKYQDKHIVGYGASTKGNVLLQFCGLGEQDLSCIAEVNEDKFGSYTPGTRIPIVSEKEAKELGPDVMMVLPWHFRPHIIAREAAYLRSGGSLLFPLPQVEMVSLHNNNASQRRLATISGD